jgi:two-component system sensor kinase FixL
MEFPESLPRVLADGDQLRIVFGNLIRNAREAMPGSGRLSLTGSHAGEHVEVAVTDTGVGIAPETSSGSSSLSTPPRRGAWAWD